MRRRNQWITVIAAMRKAMAIRAISPGHSREGASGPLARSPIFEPILHAQSFSIVMHVLIKYPQLVRVALVAE